jgi:hypothetical protein
MTAARRMGGRIDGSELQNDTDTQGTSDSLFDLLLSASDEPSEKSGQKLSDSDVGGE